MLRGKGRRREGQLGEGGGVFCSIPLNRGFLVALPAAREPPQLSQDGRDIDSQIDEMQKSPAVAYPGATTKICRIQSDFGVEEDLERRRSEEFRQGPALVRERSTSTLLVQYSRPRITHTGKSEESGDTEFVGKSTVAVGAKYRHSETTHNVQYIHCLVGMTCGYYLLNTGWKRELAFSRKSPFFRTLQHTSTSHNGMVRCICPSRGQQRTTPSLQTRPCCVCYKR